MHTRNSRQIAIWPVLLFIAVVTGAAIAVWQRPAEGGVLSDAELTELAITVRPYEGAAPVDHNRALELAREDWDPPDTSVTLDAFLVRATSPSRSQSAEPMNDRAVWIIRYNGLRMVSPGGAQITRAYSYFDAGTGKYLGTSLLK